MLGFGGFVRRACSGADRIQMTFVLWAVYGAVVATMAMGGVFPCGLGVSQITGSWIGR